VQPSHGGVVESEDRTVGTDVGHRDVAGLGARRASQEAVSAGDLARRPGQRVEINDSFDFSPPCRLGLSLTEGRHLLVQPVPEILNVRQMRGALKLPEIHRPHPHALIGQVQPHHQLQQPPQRSQRRSRHRLPESQ